MTDIQQYFNALPNKDKTRTLGMKASYKFVVKDAGTWLVHVDDGKITIGQTDADAMCTIKISAEHFRQLIDGTLNAQMAFMSGFLLIEGDMGLAMKLNAVL